MDISQSIRVKKKREAIREKHFIFIGERYDKLLHLVSNTPDVILSESFIYLTQTGENCDIWSVFLVCKRWNRLMKEAAVIPLIWRQVAKKGAGQMLLEDKLPNYRLDRYKGLTMELQPGNQQPTFFPISDREYPSLAGNKSPQVANFSTKTKISEIATNIATYYNLGSAPKEKQYIRILLTGMRRSGKTSILHFVKYGNCVLHPWNYGTTNAESIKWNEGKIQRDLLILDITHPTFAYPLEKQDKKPLLVLFVVDSTREFNSVDMESTDKKGRLYDEFHRITGMAKDQYLCVAVLANKMDLDGAYEMLEIENHLRLQALGYCGWYYNCKAEIFPTCAITGQGISKALNWLLSNWD